MFQPIDCPRKYARPPLAGLMVLGAVLLLFSPFTIAAPFGVTDETAEALQAELGDGYEVIVLSRGYVVRPTSPAADYKQIEIGERGVLVGGEAQELDQLRELLGDDANILFALAGDVTALAGVEGLRGRVDERMAVRAREIEDNIQRQVEESERLDSERAEELGEELERRQQGGESSKKARSETRFSLGSPLTIKEGQSAREAVAIFGPLIMRGEVRGDSVVVFGNAEITGRVDGDLTVVGGKILLGPKAVIDGDVTSVGGAIHQEEGARIDGEITEIVAPFAGAVSGIEFDQSSSVDGWLELAGKIFSSLFLAILVGIAALAARRRVGAVAHRARHEPWKSGLVGAMVQVLTLPAIMLISLILTVSIVGIPVLMVLFPLTILVLALVLILGYAGVAAVLGRALLTVMLGLALIQGWQILGQGMTIAGGWLQFIGYALVAGGFFLKYLAWTVGLGAVMLDRFSPLPAVAASGTSLRPGSHTFTSPFASPRSPASSPVPPPPPPPLPWEVEDDPNADREYRQAGEPAMSAAEERKPPIPEPSDEEYKDIGRKSKPSGSSF